jgi:hypothetical protein
MTAAELADKLHATKISGGWVALCPAHPDHNPSLSISVGDKQPIVITCRSHGCDPKDILAAAGLRWRDVMRPSAMTQEVRRQIAEAKKLREVEAIWRTCVVGQIEAYGTPEWDWWRVRAHRYWHKMKWLRLCIHGYERKVWS